MGFPELTQLERERLAEGALRELFAEGLIFSFRLDRRPPDHTWTPTPLDELTVDAAIAGTSWRTDPPGDTSIWLGGTQAGERAVREHWPGTTMP
jgi:hypothetical protein